jgi:hypothetical protein
MVAEAMIGIGTVLILFVPIFLSFAFAPRYADMRAARLKELKKYSIRPLDLRQRIHGTT